MGTSARAASIQRLGSEVFDVLVIGGGITGAGVALDAASRGLTTAIVDKGDWASGTSSKSSKLVHGGLRYLQQKEYRLVYENLHERQRLLQNAPHLVKVMPFLIPLFGKAGVVSASIAKAYTTALTLYDLTGGWRIGKLHKRISLEDTMKHMGGLSKAKVAAGFIYYDAQADDSRLTLAIVRTAEDFGAVAVNYLGVNELTKQNGSVHSATLSDGTIVRARCIVNAAGIWAEQVGRLAGSPEYQIRPAKGVHVTVPFAKVRADIAAVVPVREDKRSVFVVPGYDSGAPEGSPPTHIYVGTTDTDYNGPLDDPMCTDEDIEYILRGMNDWLEEPLTRDDILATWAGLRPLLSEAKSERTADLSRRHKVVRSETNVVSILGGKLTTYREMAEDTVDEVLKVLDIKAKCKTKSLRLRGAENFDVLSKEKATLAPNLSSGLVAHLVGRYGSEAQALVAMLSADPRLAEPLVAGLPYIAAEAVYAVRNEHALTIADVLDRRTRARLLDAEATRQAAVKVAGLIGPELDWNEAARIDAIAAYLKDIEAEIDVQVGRKSE